MRQVKKIESYFYEECSSMTLEWDAYGRYKGQWQPNMLSEDPMELFIGPDPEGRCLVPDLTQEEMAFATAA